MKIAIISDIHANLEALKVTIKDIKDKKVDKIICLGDIIAKGYHVHECVEIIQKECDVVLRGNCDRHFTEKRENLINKNDTEIKRWERTNNALTESEKEWLYNLPYSYEFYLSGSLVRLFHATPEADNKPIINQDTMEAKYKMFLPSAKTNTQEVADIVVYGHIHHQYMDKLYNKTLVNTGSVGNSFCLIRNPEKDSDIKEIRQANYVILQGNYGEKEYSDSVSIEFVRVPYDEEKELDSQYYFEKEETDFEIREGKYRNMKKIKENFTRLGIDMDEF